jgi:hypothetical protein
MRLIQIMESVKASGGFELVSVYSRAGLEEPLPLAMYSLKRIKAKIVEVDFNEILRISIVKAPILKLRTLDLLHIITCKVAGCGDNREV